MKQLAIYKIDNTATDDATIARKRMALFPEDSEVLFPAENLWVPVVIVNRNVFILPGVPSLFTTLLGTLKPSLASCVPQGRRQYRVIIATEEPESVIAPFLTELQARVKKEGIKVGSYPKWADGVRVSLLGKDVQRLEELAKEVEEGIKGQRRSEEEEEREEAERRVMEIEKFKRGAHRTKSD